VAVGSGLTYLVSIRLAATRRAEERARERRKALAVYLGRLTIAVAFIREWPEELAPSLRERARRATIERSARVRTSDWIHAQKRMRETFGPDLYRPLHRLIEAYSQLRFAGLDELVWQEVVRSIEYIEHLAHDRSPEALEEWTPVRRRLLDVIRKSGDEVAIEAAEPAESLDSDLAHPQSATVNEVSRDA
jgi:hypothetical protein